MINNQSINHFYITNELLGINTTNYNGFYYYHIIATDRANNHFNYSRTKDNDFLIMVIDNIKPVIHYGSGEFITTTDDEFSIQLQCSDNFGIAYATLFIRKLNSPWLDTNLNFDFNNENFIINYSDLKSGNGFNTSDTRGLEYYIMVTDLSYNFVKYSKTPVTPWIITVQDNDAPSVNYGSGDMVITTDDPFEIYVNFSDNFDVTEAILYIREAVGSVEPWFAVDMVESADDNFTITYDDLRSNYGLQLDTAKGGRYEYFIRGYDSSQNLCNYTSGVNKAWNILINDNDPPRLMSGTGDFIATTDDPFEIFATFKDNIEVSIATIYLRYIPIQDSAGQQQTQGSGSEDWFSTWMIKDKVDGSTKFYISYYNLKTGFGFDTTFGGIIEYYIVVTDSSENEFIYSGSQNDYWIITIIDNDAPLSLNGTADISVITHEHFTLSAEFQDNIAVSDATLYIINAEIYDSAQPMSWVEHNMNLESSSGDNYIFSLTNSELEIDTTYSEDDYFYYIIAIDEAKNLASYGSSENPYGIVVIDTAIPVLEQLVIEPRELYSNYDGDISINLVVSDLGGSGFDAQSVMMRYKRGSFDSVFHDFTPMEQLSIPESKPEPEKPMTTSWGFTIPKLEEGMTGWELIADEDILVEIQLTDLAGNTAELVMQSVHVLPVHINHPPVVQLINLNGNENITGTHTLFYHATDPDNDELTITISLSADDGEHWLELTTGLENQGSYSWNTSGIPDNDGYRIKITANDGEFSVSDSSETGFSIYTVKPELEPVIQPEEPKQQEPNLLLPIIAGIVIAIILSTSFFVSGTEVGRFKFFTLFLVPLYTKLHRDEVLDHFTRGQIYGYIKANPGENYNTIKESLELTNGTLSHHLKILETEDYIYSKRDGFYTRFYPKGLKLSILDASQLNKLQKIIFSKVQETPGISQHEIVSTLGASQQVISYNLTKLVRDEILTIDKRGREKIYFINKNNGNLPINSNSKLHSADAESTDIKMNLKT
jgi:DNA-binding transcriptional ArsR family regulator